jgi:hypothetical protein
VRALCHALTLRPPSYASCLPGLCLTDAASSNILASIHSSTPPLFLLTLLVSPLRPPHHARCLRCHPRRYHHRLRPIHPRLPRLASYVTASPASPHPCIHSLRSTTQRRLHPPLGHTTKRKHANSSVLSPAQLGHTSHNRARFVICHLRRCSLLAARSCDPLATPPRHARMGAGRHAIRSATANHCIPLLRSRKRYPRDCTTIQSLERCCANTGL